MDEREEEEEEDTAQPEDAEMQIRGSIHARASCAPLHHSCQDSDSVFG